MLVGYDDILAAMEETIEELVAERSRRLKQRQHNLRPVGLNF
jgi:hypothetical protein